MFLMSGPAKAARGGPGKTPPPSGLVETLQELVHGRDAAVTADRHS
jgi:hypothetical protein